MARILLSQIRYSGPEKFAVETIDVPTIGDDDVLVRNAYYYLKFSELTHERSRSQPAVYAER
jgi:hypothetical protein